MKHYVLEHTGHCCVLSEGSPDANRKVGMQMEVVGRSRNCSLSSDLSARARARTPIGDRERTRRTSHAKTHGEGYKTNTMTTKLSTSARTTIAD